MTPDDRLILEAARHVEIATRQLRKALTFVLLRRHGNTCHYCGVEMLHPVRAKELGQVWRQRTLDHIRPLSKGGGDTLDNVVLACGSCNSAKRDRTWNHAKRATG